MIEIYHNGKVLFYMPTCSTVLQVQAGAEIMAQRQKLTIQDVKLFAGGRVLLTSP